MKKITNTLLFLAFSLLSFAQTPFNEKSVQDFAARIVAEDFPKFSKEYISPDMVWSLAEGQVVKNTDMVPGMTGAKVVGWALSDLKVKQIGGMAVATGVNKHDVLNQKTNETTHYTVRFTYVFAYINNKWMWIQAHHTHIPTDAKTDTTAIKKVCMAETQAFLDHDYDAWASYHIQNADEQLVYSTPNNSFGTHSGWENISKSVKDWTKGPKPENTKTWWGNWTFALRGDMAFAAYDANVPTGEDKISRFRESSTLLRVNGQWKILAVQAYYDNPSGK